MLENKQFTGGGLDKDSSPENVAPNDVTGGYNVRFTGTQEGEDGIATNIESHIAISGTLPAGINKCIGAFGFETVRKGYSFIFNSLGYHQIKEIDFDSLSETILFTNKTDSGGIDILPLDPDCYINDLKLLQDKFLTFVHDTGEVGYINLERLKSGELGVITKDDLTLIKAPSLTSPKAYLCDDQSRSVNLLKGNMFQFAVQYVYLDNEKSAWSSWSQRPVNPAESTPVEGTDVGKANNLAVSVNIGTNRVKTINVGARIGTFDFMLIKSISRSEILNISSNTFPSPDGTFEPYDPSVSGVYEIYNPTTNTYSFAFYNDGLYPNIDVLETDLNYDHIPQKAGTMELLNGNVLALGDLTEGYERPTVDISLSTTTYNPEISIEIPVDSTRLKVDNFTEQQEGGSDPFYRYYIFFSGTAQTGDKITLTTKKHTGETLNTVEATATLTEDENTLKLVQKLAVAMPYPTNVITVGSQVRLMFSARRLSETGGTYRERMTTAPKVTLALAGTGQSKSIPAIKDNSSYQLALQFKDAYGRLFPIVTDSRFILKTQSLAQMEGQIPRFTWLINSITAPVGAVSYQWLISKNNTHESNLFVNAVLDTTNTDADYLVFKLNSLNKFNENNKSSILSYDYSAGDRCTFVSMQPAVGDKIWFNDPKVVDVEVVDYAIKTTGVAPEPIVTDYLLKVRKSSVIDGSNNYGGETIIGRDLLLEIYTPTKRASTVEGKTTYNSTLFYEIGEEYPVNNGNYTQVSGTIDSADVYYKTRQLVNATDDGDLNVYEVMDFHFSDFYESNFNSYGRARTYEDETGVKRLKSSIRYSDTSITGSEVNGINRFYTERIYGEGAGQSSSNYGAISKLFQRDNYLICIQEVKTGHIPVYSHILEDNEGSSNVAISDRILGNIRYIQSGSWGMGNAKESFAHRQDGTVYFVDPNNSLPIRDGYDGVKPIAGKMSKYFKRVIQQARNEGKKIIGYYDNYNDEYIISIEGLGDIVTTIAFTDSDWSFTDSYTIDPSTLLSTGTSNGTVSINTSTGKALFTPATDHVGSAGFGFSFADGGSVVTKNACGTVLAGIRTVDDFVFIDYPYADLSTPYESNEILVNGNTIPTPISVTGGEYSVNGGSWTSASGLVNSGDSVKVRVTSSGSEMTATNVVLTIYDKSDSFDVTTLDMPDSTPYPYAFTDVTNSERNLQTESGTALITDIEIPVAISIVGGQYQINGGAWTSADGTVENGDLVKVRITSSSAWSTAVNTTLTAGGISDTFTVTTRAAEVVPVSYSVEYGLNPTTQNGLIFTKNGAEVSRYGSEGSGIISGIFYEGDVIGIRNYSYGSDFFPWEASSNVNLTIKEEGITRYNGNVTTQATELQSDSFTIADNTVDILAEATGSSLASGYITKTLTVASNSTLAKLQITDTTLPKEVLEITDTANGTTVYPYNLYVDGNTQTLRVTNLSAVTPFSVVVNGGSSTPIPVSSFVDFTGITKDSITITVTQ